MVLGSLREGLGLLRSPSAWIPGLAVGAFAASALLLEYSAGVFMAERVFLLEMVTIPFFIAGLLSMVRTGERSLPSFVSGGIDGFFRVMLPSLIVLFAVILTILLVLLPLTIIGVASQTSMFVGSSVTVTILFFAYFYDTAAIIEGRGVFDSVRRSVEFVLQNVRDCILFYLTAIAIAFLILFVTMIAWTSVLYEKVLPLASLDPTQIQALSVDQFNSMLGYDGILTSSVLLFIGTAILVSVVTCYKACFFRDRSTGPVTEPVKQGEYDSKGRWYKY